VEAGCGIPQPAATFLKASVCRGSMKFIVEIPDREVFEAAEQPEDLACEIAEVIANEIFGFSSVSVIPQQQVRGALGLVRS
jgi:hypothetical protein